MELHMEHPEEREGRKLSSKNKKRQTLYTEEVTKNLEFQNAWDRAADLMNKAQSCRLSNESVLKYNNLDDIITQTMLAAERKLPRQRESQWTPELGRLIHKIRYLKLLLRQKRGVGINPTILKTLSAKAECAWTGQSKADILHQLCATWRALDKYK